MAIFNSYVSLPEGNHHFSMVPLLFLGGPHCSDTTIVRYLYESYSHKIEMVGIFIKQNHHYPTKHPLTGGYIMLYPQKMLLKAVESHRIQ